MLNSGSEYILKSGRSDKIFLLLTAKRKCVGTSFVLSVSVSDVNGLSEFGVCNRLLKVEVEVGVVLGEWLDLEEMDDGDGKTMVF